MSFSPTQMALEGFRLVRRRPVSFIVWSLLMGLTMEASFAGFIYLFGEVLVSAPDWPAGKQGFPTDQFLKLLGWIAGMMVVLLLAMTALVAGVYRAVVAPKRRAFAYLRLGGAELRLIALQIMVTAIVAICELLILGVIEGVSASSLLLEAKIAVGALAGLGLAAAGIFVLVRLSLVGPLIVARGRMDFERAWEMSRGRFWALLLTGVLAFVLSMAVSMLANVLMQPMMLALMPQFGGAPSISDPLAGWRYMSDHREMFAALALLGMPALALQLVVQSAPFAAAYRELSQPR